MSSISTDVERDEQGEWGSETKGEGHYADVNGIKLYYEIHGTGRPLILLHGGLGAIEMFGPNLTIEVFGVKFQQDSCDFSGAVGPCGARGSLLLLHRPVKAGED